MQIFLGLADVLAHDLREVDLVQVQPEFPRDDFGGHRLAGSRRTREEHVESATERELLLKTPFAVHHVAMPGLNADLAKLRELVVGQHDLLPVVARLDLLRERSEPRSRLIATRALQVVQPDLGLTFYRR